MTARIYPMALAAEITDRDADGVVTEIEVTGPGGDRLVCKAMRKGCISGAVIHGQSVIIIGLNDQNFVFTNPVGVKELIEDLEHAERIALDLVRDREGTLAKYTRPDRA